MSKPAKVQTPPKLALKPYSGRLIALERVDYLTSRVVEVTLEDGIEVARREVHPPDVARVALAKGLEALEKMVEDR